MSSGEHRCSLGWHFPAAGLFPLLSAFLSWSWPSQPCPCLCFSLPANLLCHNLPAALGAFLSKLLLDCSLLCLPQVRGWVPALGIPEASLAACGPCSWRPGACFHLPAVPGIAGEIVPVVLCRTWEAYSACRGLGFIFYIFLASAHVYFLMLMVT